MLERSVAQVNSYFMDHKLMLGVINVAGPFSKSRLAVPLIYFNTFECIVSICDNNLCGSPPVGDSGARAQFESESVA